MVRSSRKNKSNSRSPNQSQRNAAAPSEKMEPTSSSTQKTSEEPKDLENSSEPPLQPEPSTSKNQNGIISSTPLPKKPDDKASTSTKRPVLANIVVPNVEKLANENLVSPIVVITPAPEDEKTIDDEMPEIEKDLDGKEDEVSPVADNNLPEASVCPSSEATETVEVLPEVLVPLNKDVPGTSSTVEEPPKEQQEAQFSEAKLLEFTNLNQTSEEVIILKATPVKTPEENPEHQQKHDFKKSLKPADLNMNQTSVSRASITATFDSSSYCERHQSQPTPSYYSPRTKSFDQNRTTTRHGGNTTRSGLCGSCRKLMVSYVSVVQDLLTNMMTNIEQGCLPEVEDSCADCYMCLKESILENLLHPPVAQENSNVFFAPSETHETNQPQRNETNQDWNKENQESESHHQQDSNYHHQQGPQHSQNQNFHHESSRQPESHHQTYSSSYAQNQPRQENVEHVRRNSIPRKFDDYSRSSDVYVSSRFEGGQMPREAWITIANNDLSALSALVLGHSLDCSGTPRARVILISDNVGAPMKTQLESAFDMVIPLRSMDLEGTTQVSLLGDQSIGVSYSKLHLWRVDQFDKCVYMDPDILVTKNCDELFGRSDMSAVPDVGWPDCFNTGVLVYKPSKETFNDIINYATRNDSYDGGDQGLLNMYFKSWPEDIDRRLPFIYNLVANVTYTYLPAIKRFAGEVKVIQFAGAYKPWHVPYNPKTGEISQGANMNPSYEEYIRTWVRIFTEQVYPHVPEEIKRRAESQDYITPQELLNMFPGTKTNIDDLPPPSTARAPTVPDLSTLIEDARRSSQSAPAIQTPPSEPEEPKKPENEKPSETVDDNVFIGETKDDETENVDEKTDETEEVDEEVSAEFEDFRTMNAWEQGRVDYLGRSSFENIQKRLDFMMQGSQSPKQ